MPTPPPPTTALQVSVGSFTGTLSALAQALRSGTVSPAEVPLLALTRDLLARVAALHEDDQLEALPLLAGVIALKAKLLLPGPEPEVSEWADTDDLGLDDDFVEGVETLAELDALTSFLARRRAERSGLIAGKAVALALPRRERRKAGPGLAQLLRAAQQAVREVTPPLLSRERLTLAGALHALRAFGRRLGRFTLLSIPAQDWGERSSYFAALLEGVKEGDFSAEQVEPFADIDIVNLRTEES